MSAAAFFDVDGTIARSDIVRYYVHFRTRGRSAAGRALWILGYLPAVARWLWLDRIDRGRMNVEFYRSYAGMDAAELERVWRADYPAVLGRHVFPAARARIAEHRARGERVVLVTGSLDFLMRPLLEDVGADDLIAVRLEQQAGRFTGVLDGGPLAGQAKVRAVARYAERHAIDLAPSWAYGDSIADAPVLAMVGRAVAVRPDRALRALARARGWEIARWARGA